MSRPVNPNDGGYDPSEGSLDQPEQEGVGEIKAEEDEDEGRIEA